MALDNHGERTNKRVRHQRAVRDPTTYQTDDAFEVLRAIERLTAAGWAIRLGKSRDGGALAIGVYGDSQGPYTDYFGPSEDWVKYLIDLADEVCGSVSRSV